jgi:recombinational DNA repair protein (RecF pathway)
VRYFEFWLLRLHGVFADLDRCAACGGALPASGACAAIPGEGLACRACAAGREVVRLPAQGRVALLRIASEAPARVADLAEICGPGGALAKVLRTSVESFLEKRPKAYRHLEAMA